MNATVLKLWLGVMSVLLLLTESTHAFYNPELGRWINRDPIGEEGGVNLHGFVKNDPIAKRDSFGLIIYGDGVDSETGERSYDCLCNNTVGKRVWDQVKNAGIEHGNVENGGNAFQHCLAACRSTRVCGRTSAKRFWDGREDDPNDPDDSMDLNNNALGYDMQGDCWNGCMTAWRNGGLTCLNADREPIPCPPPPRNYSRP